MEQDSARTLKWHKDVWLTVLRFQFRRNLQIARSMLDRDRKEIGLTADLAILYILLVNPGRFIYENLVPLTAARALEARFHFILRFDTGYRRSNLRQWVSPRFAGSE